MSKESILEELAREVDIVETLYDEVSQPHFRDPQLDADRKEELEQLYCALIQQYRALETQVDCTFDEKELNERAFAELETLVKKGVHTNLYRLSAIRTCHGMHGDIALPVMALVEQALDARVGDVLQWDIAERYKIPLRIAQYRLSQERRRMNILDRNVAQNTERAETLLSESRTFSYLVKEHFLGLDIMRKKTERLQKERYSREDARGAEGADDENLERGNGRESAPGIMPYYLLYRVAPLASVLVGVPACVALGHPIIGALFGLVGVMGEFIDMAVHGKYSMYTLASRIQQTLALGKR